MIQTAATKFKHILVPGLDFDLPAETTTEGRYYSTPNGNKYPSASSVSGVLNRDAIEKWRKKVGAVEADKKTKRGADRGTNVHLICEKYLLETLTPFEMLGMMPTMKELFLQLKREFDAHIDTVYAIEQVLYSDRLRIAGRTDGIVSWDYRNTILDVKTSTKGKPEAWITNYFVQATAYAEMYEERTGIPIDDIVIAMACEDELKPTIYKKKKQEYLPILDICLKQYYSEHPELA